MKMRLFWLFLVVFGILEFVNIVNLFPVTRFGMFVVDLDNIVGIGIVIFGGLQLSKHGGRI